MKKKAGNNENIISLKGILKVFKEIIVGVIVGLLVALILANFTSGEKNNVMLLLFFFVGLIAFILIILIRSLITEVKDKKDLERQKEKLEEALELKEMFLFHAEKDKEKLSQEKKKLENERNQLSFVLIRCRVNQEEVGIDGNISFHEWHDNPEIQKKVKEVTNKTYNELQEAERDVFHLSFQLEQRCGIAWDKQDVSNKRMRKWAIERVEENWIINTDKNDKIRDKTMEQFLGKHWRDNFENREGEDIYKEAQYLIEKIMILLMKNK